tara:strand:- start:55097 stop:56848 length:1752 start_codon:yes stop_codon:yes gene_type:complete
VKRFRSAGFGLLGLWLCAANLHAQNLTYTLEGLDAELEKNVHAWLGSLPDAVHERQNFVVSARDRVKGALQALGYYRPDVDIAVDKSPPVWQMQIVVDAGEPVRYSQVNLSILGDAASDAEFEELLADTSIRSGERLHHGQYQSFKKQLQSLGQQRGYFDARFVTSRVEVEAGMANADAELVYDSGKRYRFGTLLHDPELTDADLLAALQPFDSGDYFELSELQLFQTQLQRTRYFSSVLVQPRPALAQGQEIPIDVKLHPAKRHNFDVGVGYSTDTEERVSLSWRTPRINRFGHSQLTRLEYSRVNPSGRITYNIPLTHPLNDILQLWGRLEDNEFGDLNSEQQELGARREIRSNSRVLGYSLRALNESWSELNQMFDNEYLLFGASWSNRTQRGSVIDPQSGFSQLLTVEAAGKELGSDVNVLRMTANLRYIASPWPLHRVVARADLGVARLSNGDRDNLAPSLSFFTGGNQSIRGFGYNSIGNEVPVTRADGSAKTIVTGGDRLAVASVEYQYYFTDQWRGALFIDGGDAFDEGEFDMNYGAGFGVHYITPVGAVRLELGNSLSKDNPDWQVHLTIGAEF